MTFLYARSDLAEVQTPAGRTYKAKTKGGYRVVDADPADVPDLLATGSLVETPQEVPLTFDEQRDAERVEHDADLAMQGAARALADMATDSVSDRGGRRPRRRDT